MTISVPIWREAAYGQGLYLFIRIHGPIPDITADTIRVFNIAQGIKDTIKFSAWFAGDLSTLGTRVASLAGVGVDELAPAFRL